MPRIYFPLHMSVEGHLAAEASHVRSLAGILLEVRYAMYVCNASSRSGLSE